MTKRSSIPILGLLTFKPMSGYELKKEIEGSLQYFWSESFGQLYPQLQALEKAELIEQVPSETGQSRKKKTYAITTAGRAALAKWLQAEPVRRPPRDELLMKVFFAPEGDIGAVRDHCIKAREKALATLEHFEGIDVILKKMLPANDKAKYWAMTLNLGISQTKDFIAWCDETLAEFP